MKFYKLIKFVRYADYRFLVLSSLGFYNKISDEKYVKKMFKVSLGRQLNLTQPTTFNEKLQWLKLYDRKTIYTKLVDKYLVREYVANKIGKEYLIPLLGVWDSPKEIDFNKLPNQFVLKCNHNSGLGMCICKNKNNLNPKKVQRELKKGLKQNYFLTGREWPYKNVKRRIIAEKFMSEKNGADLKDYKFFCFNGKVKFFKIDFDRFLDHRANYFNLNMEQLPFGEQVCPPDYNKKLEIPSNIYKMIELAENLSKNIPFLRVDFYNLNGKIYFGELTFFPASGFGKFIPEDWDEKIGAWLVIEK